MKNEDNYNFIANTKERSSAMIGEYENSERLLKFLGEEIATVKQTLQTYRTINHWDGIGLLLPQKSSDNTWRKFSIADLFWINVIDSLREFGYPIEKIKTVKDQLFGKSPKKEKINRYIFDTLMLDGDWNILVYSNGKITFQNGTASTAIQNGSDFIRISLYDVLGKILKSKDVSQLSPTIGKNELELLLDIRKGKYNEITIKLKDGEIIRFDSKEDVVIGAADPFQTIKELIKGEEYQDIVVKRQGGKIVSIQRTKKSKSDMP